MGQMRTIMECQSTPTIIRVICCPAERSQYGVQSVQPIVVSGSSIGDIPGESGVVEFVRIDGTVVDGSCALIDVDVACQDKINGVLVQRKFEGL